MLPLVCAVVNFMLASVSACVPRAYMVWGVARLPRHSLLLGTCPCAPSSHSTPHSCQGQRFRPLRTLRDVVKYVCTVGHHIVSCLVLLVTVRAWISSCAFRGGGGVANCSPREPHDPQQKTASPIMDAETCQRHTTRSECAFHPVCAQCLGEVVTRDTHKFDMRTCEPRGACSLAVSRQCHHQSSSCFGEI